MHSPDLELDQERLIELPHDRSESFRPTAHMHTNAVVVKQYIYRFCDRRESAQAYFVGSSQHGVQDKPGEDRQLGRFYILSRFTFIIFIPICICINLQTMKIDVRIKNLVLCASLLLIG